MKVSFSKLEWAGAALLFGGPLLCFAAGQMSLRESVEGHPSAAIGSAMSALSFEMTDTHTLSDMTGMMSRFGKAVGKSGEKVRRHNARAHAYAHAVNAGFVLFLLGVALFLIGVRQRLLALIGGNAEKAGVVAQHASPDA